MKIYKYININNKNDFILINEGRHYGGRYGVIYTYKINVNPDETKYGKNRIDDNTLKIRNKIYKEENA